jgi:hypothetical protein
MAAPVPPSDDNRRRENIPDPDPSKVTVDQMASLRSDLIDRFDRSIAALTDKIETRINAIDKANIVLSENVNRVPTQLQQAVETLGQDSKKLKELLEVKVSGGADILIGKMETLTARMDGMKELSAELRKTADTAINAAFSAADKVGASQFASFLQQINKSEASFTKEIDSLKSLITSTKSALDAQISDLKERQTRGEGGATGNQQGSASTLSIILGAAGIITILLSVFFFAENRQSAAVSPTPSAVVTAPLNPSALQPAR